MVFNIRLSLANFDQARPNRNCLLIADTVLINSDNIEVLTKGIPKAYADISYSIDENDEVNETEEGNSTAPAASSKVKSEQINTSSRGNKNPTIATKNGHVRPETIM